MRSPTTREQAWAFWTNAVSLPDPSRAPRAEDSTPQAGLYKVRKWRNPANPNRPGPWVPARIELIPGEIDIATGELLSQETMRAEIDGKPADPQAVWLYGRVATLSEWQWLEAESPLLPPIPPGCVGP